MASEGGTNLAGMVVNGSRHFCAFFRTEDEEFWTLLPFIREGLDAGEKAIHILSATTREHYRRRLTEDGGIDVAAAEQSGQFDIVAWPNSHLLDGGTFDPERASDMIDEVLSRAREQGYRRTRGIGYMCWALRNRIRVDDLMAYEARLNVMLPRYDDPIVCAYDLSHATGSMVVDIMRTHPAALIGGALQQNPFYIPPEQMLEELRGRHE